MYISSSLLALNSLKAAAAMIYCYYMHFDTAPFILSSEAVAAVCMQKRGKRIRLYIELLQGREGKRI